jgi:hypothetical protein
MQGTPRKISLPENDRTRSSMVAVMSFMIPLVNTMLGLVASPLAFRGAYQLIGSGIEKSSNHRKMMKLSDPFYALISTDWRWVANGVAYRLSLIAAPSDLAYDSTLPGDLARMEFCLFAVALDGGLYPSEAVANLTPMTELAIRPNGTQAWLINEVQWRRTLQSDGLPNVQSFLASNGVALPHSELKTRPPKVNYELF